MRLQVEDSQRRDRLVDETMARPVRLETGSEQKLGKRTAVLVVYVPGLYTTLTDVDY